MDENSDKYAIRVVQGMAEFLKLEYEWNRLIENCKYHVPFLCFDWFRIWLNHFLGNNELFIILVYDENKLAAIAPFIIKNEKFRGTIKIRKIELIGNAHSSVRNFIFNGLSDDEKKTILANIFSFLTKKFKEWDVLELDSMPEEDTTLSITDDVINITNFTKRQYFCFGDWYLDGINYSGDEYMKRRSKNTRSGVGKKKRRLERLGKLEFVIEEDIKKLDYCLNLYQEIRIKSWKHPEIDLGFLKESRRMISEKGWLKFSFLFLNNLPIATLFAFVSNEVAYMKEIVYDLEYDEYSPGEIIYAEFIKYLIDVHRVTEIDQLRGDEPYKKSWTPQRRERKGILVFNNTVKGRFCAFLMAKFLPIVEKNKTILATKNRLITYFRKPTHE